MANRGIDNLIQDLMVEIKVLERELVTLNVMHQENTEEIHKSLNQIVDNLAKGIPDLGPSVNAAKLTKSLSTISDNLGSKSAGEINHEISTAIKSSWADKSKPITLGDIKKVKGCIYTGNLPQKMHERAMFDAGKAKCSMELSQIKLNVNLLMERRAAMEKMKSGLQNSLKPKSDNAIQECCNKIKNDKITSAVMKHNALTNQANPKKAAEPDKSSAPTFHKP